MFVLYYEKFNVVTGVSKCYNTFNLFCNYSLIYFKVIAQFLWIFRPVL